MDNGYMSQPQTNHTRTVILLLGIVAVFVIVAVVAYFEWPTISGILGGGTIPAYFQITTITSSSMNFEYYIPSAATQVTYALSGTGYSGSPVTSSIPSNRILPTGYTGLLANTSYTLTITPFPGGFPLTVVFTTANTTPVTTSTSTSSTSFILQLTNLSMSTATFAFNPVPSWNNTTGVNTATITLTKAGVVVPPTSTGSWTGLASGIPYTATAAYGSTSAGVVCSVAFTTPNTAVY